MERSLRRRNYIPIIDLSNDDIDRNNHGKNTVSKRSTVMKEKDIKIIDTRVVDIDVKVNTHDVQSIKSMKLKGVKRIRFESKESEVPNKKQKKAPIKVPKKTKTTTELRVDVQNNITNRSKNATDVNLADKQTEWTILEYVSEVTNLDEHVVQNVIKLFNEDNTIPFIARYRKYMTNGLEPEQLRLLHETYEEAKTIQQRAATIITAIDKAGKWTPEIHSNIRAMKNLNDLEHFYSLYKVSPKKSLADRARKLGLEPISMSILKGQGIPNIVSLVNETQEGLETEQAIRNGIVHILADIICKDKSIFNSVQLLQNTSVIMIETTQCASSASAKQKVSKVDDSKYQIYFNFKIDEKNIKPHQILAINRGESQKVLNVKIIIPDSFERQFHTICSMKYSNCSRTSPVHMAFLNDSISYAYKKSIKQLISRRVRSELKRRAETASIEVFACNVKNLLLTPPTRGKVILGIDPGFYHGCKLAVISQHGNILDIAVIYPHTKSENAYKDSSKKLVDLVNEYKVDIVALGNGTACRETELFLTKLLQSHTFNAKYISYTIVDEAGASIYSCGSEAKAEFPDMDPNIISAVSIARRLQDPLAELVKVEPKHLGVGMYQHDLPEKQLTLSLNEVVSEAVSFVGVDVNTASHCLLKRVAGLNKSKATNILEWRKNHGPFINRQQLMKVKGIGSKTFEQCAGFIRIVPETAIIAEKKAKRGKGGETTLNVLDQTWIHPESYEVVNRFLEVCECNLQHFGSVQFINRIQRRTKDGCAMLAKELCTNETTLEIIIKGLTMKTDEDIRSQRNCPLFRNCLRSVKDVSVGTVLSGAVRNVIHFGAFVDVGLGRDGLIHVTCMKGKELSIGQHVEVQITHIDENRNRIGLELLKIL